MAFLKVRHQYSQNYTYLRRGKIFNRDLVEIDDEEPKLVAVSGSISAEKSIWEILKNFICKIGGMFTTIYAKN